MLWAHSINEAGDRHDLQDHLDSVAGLAGTFSEAFGGEALAHLAGRLHDIGKSTDAFQNYLELCEREPGRKHPTVGHKGAGTVVAAKLTPNLALLIDGHHGGLRDAAHAGPLVRDLKADEGCSAGIRAADEAGLLDDLTSAMFPGWIDSAPKMDLFLRLLFSALVDADHFDTERHFNPAHSEARGSTLTLQSLSERIERTIEAMSGRGDGAVAAVREEVYRASLEAAALEPGFFRLTVPTGGGKTLSGMAFALRHAIAHGMDRVIVAAPYLTITDQTADVYRSAFNDERAVLEHFGGGEEQEAAEGGEAGRALWQRLAAQDWDAPVVVTTAVQLFESLFGNRPATCRKVHRIARSVILLDEAQSLPPGLLEPILSMLSGLVAHTGVSVVFCTATQPAFEHDPGFSSVTGVREIAPDPPRLFSLLRRVRYERATSPMEWTDVAEMVAAEPRLLAIVNTKADALALLDAMDDPDALHLSTLLCPAHRRDVLERVRTRLRDGRACRLISTQVVEAGVDLDFPVVLRAMGPLDRMVQAAGRCNREGKLDEGRVVIFEPARGGMPPGPYRTAADQTRSLLGPDADLHDPALFQRYFRLLHQALNLDGKEVQRLRERLAFKSVAERARLIDDDQVGVAVRYEGMPEEPGVSASSHHAERSSRAIDALRDLDQGSPARLRARLSAVQPYVINVRRRAFDEARASGMVGELAGGTWVWEGGYDGLRGMTAADPERFVI